MPGPVMSLHKTGTLSVAFILICLLIFWTTSLHDGSRVVQRLKESAKGAANNICNNDRPVFGKPTITDSFQRLFESIHHPASAPAYTDAFGNVFEAKEDGPWWKEPLRNEILILDIDTRLPQGQNELWNDGRLNWDKMSKSEDMGMISASFMNHFLYCKYSNTAK